MKSIRTDSRARCHSIPGPWLRRSVLCLALGLAGAAGAQALRPLPPAFLATLAEIDRTADGLAPLVRRFKADDLAIRAPSPARVDEAIARLDRAIATARSQTDQLRQRESLMVLLSMKGGFGALTSDVVAVVGMLQSATVRSPAALDRLNAELAELEKAQARLAQAITRFDAAATALLERLDAQAGERR